MRKPRTNSGVTRRDFVTTAAGAALAGTMASPLNASIPTGRSAESAVTNRAAQAHAMRVAAADYARSQAAEKHVDNGDETRYDSKWASFSKCLPHDELAHADAGAYRAYRHALDSGSAEELEKIPLGGYVKLANPLAALAFELAGPDAQQIALAPPPQMHSEERAAELIELYWLALLRDVRFFDYESNDVVNRACMELTALRAFSGPRDRGAVTPRTLFRGRTRGGRTGYYISQFLLRDMPFGAMKVPQKYRVAKPGLDYLTNWEECRALQNGGLAPSTSFIDGTAYMTAGRNLSEYVHRDFTYQAFLAAALTLLKISAPLDGGVPYQYSISQGGFVTFGAPDVLHYVSSAANCSLKASWFQKWLVHRTARPEEIGVRVHCHLAKKAEYPLHRSVLQSEAVDETRRRFGTALLPQAYPEGCPTHPAYPAGHAVIAGACTTVLKAWFNERWVLPQSSVPNRDGSALVPYHGPDLTVGGELDKLAENVAYGRNYAGVHWRSDAQAGLEMGETFAIQYMREMKMCSREQFQGFSLTKFDGTAITI